MGFRAHRRVLFGFVASASVLVGLAAAGACLPDLASVAAAEDASFEGVAPPFRGCGDGIVATLDDGGDAGESCDPGEIDADVPGCTACRITCETEAGLDPTSGHCYFVAGADTSYNGALNRCKGARAHVVTFASASEVAFVDGIAQGSAGYWVSLSRSPTLNEAYGPADRPEEPGFPYPPAGIASSAGPCDGCFGIGADGGVFSAGDVDASDTNCIASRAGAWFQVPCSSGPSRPTVCEREPAGVRAQDCIGGFCFNVPATAGTKTYLVVVSSADPDQAAQSCAGLTGGSLVVFGTREEREQIAHEIVNRDPTAVQQELWIGLSTNDAGVWSWDDGVLPQNDRDHPAPWGNAQPSASSGTRAYMRIAANAYDTQLAYADDGTRKPRLYVCQRSP